MKRVLVVPWSTAPTKSATADYLRVFEGRKLARFLGCVGREEAGHEDLVEPGAGDPTDDGGDDRDPEVDMAVLVLECPVIAGDELGQARSEVTGRVDRVAGVRTPGHADRD